MPQQQRLGAQLRADGELLNFPRPVAMMVADLVNTYGVTYRMQKGNGHVFLYGGPLARPYKISASRPAETSLAFLEKWVAANVPGHRLSAQREEQSMGLEVVKDEEAPMPEWVPVVYSTGKKSTCIETNAGGAVRCTVKGCGWEAKGRQGMHLHEAKHTGTASKTATAAAATRNAARAHEKDLAAQKQVHLHAAVAVIAEHFGIAPDTAEVEALRAENAALKGEVGDLKAKLALIKEAMKA